MNLPSFRRRHDVVEDERDANALSFDQYAELLQQFAYGGNNYLTAGPQTTFPGSRQEVIGPEFRSLAQLAYRTNGVVFACMLTRMLLASEARFMFRQRRDGRPGNLFSNKDLRPLERPWPGGTTGDLIGRALQYADLAGNAFMVLRPEGRIKFLRPDWTSIIIGSNGDPNVTGWDVDAEVLGYVYEPPGEQPEHFLVDEVAHFAPIPDPMARFRGMSWITPVIREVMADKAMIDHKLAFMENAATPNLAVKLDVPDLATFNDWIAAFKKKHDGSQNAYKTMFLAAGADVTPIGTDLRQLDFKQVQGGGETRIAAAARLHPVVVGLSEGLQGSSLNSGNFGAARRLVADGFLRPTWRNLAGSLANIINVPGDAELWYDDHDVAFVQEDVQDKATIDSTNAGTIRTLVDAGFEPNAVVDAVTAGDLARLAGTHSGLFSVQLQPAGQEQEGEGLLQGVPVPDDPKAPPPAAAPAATAAPTKRSDELPAIPFQLSLHLHDGRSGGDPSPQPLAQPQEPPSVNFADGAFRFDVQPAQAPEVHVTVEAGEPPRVEFAERAIVVEAAPTPDVNVTVEAGEAPKVEFAERAIVVEAAPAPEVNVTVEAAEAPKVDFAEGAIRVDVAAAPAPDVNITVEAQEAPRVEIAEGAVRVDVAAAPAPDVTVTVQPDLHATLELGADTAEALRADAPAVTINVEPTPVTVENTVNVPETPVTVNVEQPGDGPKEITFRRNADGTIKTAKLTDLGTDG